MNWRDACGMPQKRPDGTEPPLSSEQEAAIKAMLLPSWLTNDAARELREDFPEDRTCDECRLPLWVCFAISEEAIRRGGLKHHRPTVEAEARAALGRMN